jgi:putative endonuclease
MFGSNFYNKFRGRKAQPFHRAHRAHLAHLALGEFGERLIVEHLKRQGYRIVATNFQAPIGHSLAGRLITGEIDIIAYDESTRPYTLVFIEVKTRSSDEIAAPEAAVDLRKQRQIIRTARVYRRITDVSEEPYRYDVASVVMKSGGAPNVTVWRGYFSEQRFRQSGWRQREF